MKTNITLLAANRPRLLRQTLGSIGDISNSTVTIRDCGMNNEVGHIVEEWCEGKHNAESFWSNIPTGTGPSRNEVIAKSEEYFGRGEYLYIGDDDTFFLQQEWISIITQAYDEAWDHGFRAIGLYGHPFNRPIDGEPGVEYQHYTVYPVYALASQSMLMRWSVWDQFGPFCDTPAGKVCQSEDVAFSNKIREAGYKVGVISPALLVNTGITNSFGEHIPGWELVKSQAPEGIICE